MLAFAFKEVDADRIRFSCNCEGVKSSTTDPRLGMRLVVVNVIVKSPTPLTKYDVQVDVI